MTVSKDIFAKMPDGTNVEIYTITNTTQLSVSIITYGGIITNILMPDKNGNFDDVVLGFDDFQSYIKNLPYFGCITGRYANRIANGKFSLEGKNYTLAVNNGPNHIHGGIKGFDKVIWNAKTIKNGIELRYLSKDGDQGYPGNLDCTVIYTLSEDNQLKIQYLAQTDKPTIVNLTNHSYFNLAGQGNGDILDHQLTINADSYTPVDQNATPTGKILPVKDTPFDFNQPKKISDQIDQLINGYDHNYVLNKTDKALSLAAIVNHHPTARIMKTYTTQPGIQFYTGNFLDGTITGKSGKTYKKHYGFCLETQHFPDSPNQRQFPSTLLYPGQIYNQTTIYEFDINI